ncbi:hypothetical protein BJX61DRAFT_520683 [Aspergillus egyptiacus]|nr:hypothetical protein BJX61DRAFT_520683 [Aspergillus egyptiacus]
MTISTARERAQLGSLSRVAACLVKAAEATFSGKTITIRPSNCKDEEGEEVRFQLRRVPLRSGYVYPRLYQRGHPLWWRGYCGRGGADASIRAMSRRQCGPSLRGVQELRREPGTSIPEANRPSEHRFPPSSTGNRKSLKGTASTPGTSAGTRLSATSPRPRCISSPSTEKA